MGSMKAKHKEDNTSPIMKTGPHDRHTIAKDTNHRHPKPQDHMHLKGADAGHLGKPWHESFED